jgi:hypothetical protein
MLRSARALACVTIAFSASVPARAEPGAVEDADIGRAPLRWHGGDEGVAPEKSASRAATSGSSVDRPFLYLVDPRLPLPLRVVVGSGAGYTSTEAASRPLAANAGRGGFVGDLRLELGLHERLSVFATGRLAPPLDQEQRTRGAFDGGVRALATSPESRDLRVALDAGFLHDFRDASGALLRATATYDIGRLRLGALAHAERVFGIGRDEIDFYAVAGASVRVVDRLRLGAEYVGQDLEEVESEGAEGGARQFASGSVAWSSERVSIAAGPAFGLGGRAPTLLGRAQLSVAF